jgi:hypothetical protein
MSCWVVVLAVVIGLLGCSTRSVVVNPEDLPKLNDQQWTIKSDPLSARGPQQPQGATVGGQSPAIVPGGQSPVIVPNDPDLSRHYTDRECILAGGRWLGGRCRR